MYVVCVCEYRLPEAHCTLWIDSNNWLHTFWKTFSFTRRGHTCFCFLESSCLVGGRVLREFSWVAVVWCSMERILSSCSHGAIAGDHRTQMLTSPLLLPYVQEPQWDVSEPAKDFVSTLCSGQSEVGLFCSDPFPLWSQWCTFRVHPLTSAGGRSTSFVQLRMIKRFKPNLKNACRVVWSDVSFTLIYVYM